MRRITLLAVAVAAAVTLAARPARSQNFVLEFPEVSQQASISQRIGLTDITIDYHRPGVNARTIWGDLVPYDQVWRAGANENTVIRFSSDVSVGGKPLPAGAYGLHMIPTPKDWTVIFSRQSEAWGSFSYDEKEDALRITVTPEAAPMEERLSYQMDNPTDKAVTIAMNWEKLRVPFTVEVDVPAVVATDLRDRQLRGLPRFFWQGWNQAAAWCLRNNTNLDEAMTWVDRSIALSETFNNLSVKAGLLEKKGDAKTAADLRARALTIAGESDVNLYAYQLLGQGKHEEALKLFQGNVRKYPNSWNAWDSLAEAYATIGRKSEAVSNYRKALAMTSVPDQKKRIEAAIAKLE
jgi:tetratricopeptide (TPR) repeat protein